MATLSLHQKILRDFPHLTPSAASLSSYTGFLRTLNGTYRLSVTSLNIVSGDAALRSILTRIPAPTRRRITQAPDTHALLIELRDAIERAAPTAQKQASSLPPASFYERLLADIASLGWSFITSMSPCMTSLSLTTADPAKRPHTLTLSLPPTYPRAAPTPQTTLPTAFALPWGASSTLSSALAAFQEALLPFQSLFDALDDLDAHCTILEPEHPLRSHLHRRIALSAATSLLLTLSPTTPLRTVPDTRFLGPASLTNPLRTLLNANMSMWDTSGTVLPRANIEKVLGIALPKPQAGNAEESGGECGICYAYRIEDRVPDVACDRAECARPYHRECIVEWLKALPDTRQSFDTLFGKCPYCEEGISVAVGEG